MEYRSNRNLPCRDGDFSKLAGFCWSYRKLKSIFDFDHCSRVYIGRLCVCFFYRSGNEFHQYSSELARKMCSNMGGQELIGSGRNFEGMGEFVRARMWISPWRCLVTERYYMLTIAYRKPFSPIIASFK